jgi:prepilin-type N-terminal cleavage/methylation domain-containing protein/prepilin-type processing-associated H-X9-DG protein
MRAFIPFSHAKNQHRPHGFTLIELIVLLAILGGLALLVTILSPRRRCGGMSTRLVCASNIKGLGTNMKIYANDYNEKWPMVGFDETAERVTYVVPVGGGAGTLRSPKRSQPSRSGPGGATELAVTRALWLLVRSGNTTVKQFICPSTGDRYDSTDDIERYYDFTDSSNVSYGYQVPFGPRLTRAHERADNRMALVADKGPYVDRTVPTPPAGLSPRAPSENWRAFNSGNHAGEGQNVLFADGHVRFHRTPAVGIDNDNIFTVALDNTHPASRIAGESPWIRSARPYAPVDSVGKPLASTDSVIYP